RTSRGTGQPVREGAARAQAHHYPRAQDLPERGAATALDRDSNHERRVISLPRSRKSVRGAMFLGLTQLAFSRGSPRGYPGPVAPETLLSAHPWRKSRHGWAERGSSLEGKALQTSQRSEKPC